MFVQFFVADLFSKKLFVVEEVQLFLIRHRDLRMFLQLIMQRSCSALLRAGNDEIELIDFAVLDHWAIGIAFPSETANQNVHVKDPTASRSRSLRS